MRSQDRKIVPFSGPPFLRSWDRIFHFFENVIFVVQGPQNRYFLVFSILWSLDRNFNFLFFVKKYYFCNSLAYFLYYIYKQKQKIQIYSKYRFCGPDFTKYTNMQFYVIFLQKNLRMSKKSSTFAS